MTPDEIETAAIEAAAEEMAKWDDGYIWEDLPEGQKNVYRKGAERICRAYERAMWRPISELGNHRTGQVLIADLADPDSGTPQRPYHSLELINVDSMFNQNSGNKVDARYLSHFQYFRPVPPLPRREGE